MYTQHQPLLILEFNGAWCAGSEGGGKCVHPAPTPPQADPGGSGQGSTQEQPGQLLAMVEYYLNQLFENLK